MAKSHHGVCDAKGVLYIFIVVLLAGCASNLEAGMAKFNAGNYRAALPHFRACANERITACMNNMGVTAERLGNTTDAKDWYTLAARYGEPNAIQNLNKHGWAVPAADLTSSANNNGEVGVLDVLNAAAGPFMDGYNRGGGSNSNSESNSNSGSTCGYKSDGNYHCGTNCGYKSDGNYHCGTNCGYKSDGNYHCE